MQFVKRIFMVFLSCLVFSTGMMTFSAYAATGEAKDQNALQGLTTVRPLFDLNVGNAEELLFYLQVIQQTVDSLQKQGQTVDCIVAIRGGAVRLVTTDNWAFGEEDQAKLQQAGAIMAEMAKNGVKFEACSVAMNIFRVDPKTLLSYIKAVGNTFISLIGYQTKGYVVVPVK
jgi:intracellular sulfur oxidation DsrE/DsrF family protein